MIAAIWLNIKPYAKHCLSKHCTHLQGPSAVPSTVSWLVKALTTTSHQYIIRTDIKRYYASIHRGILYRQLSQIFDDPRLLHYFKAIVNPCIDRRGICYRSETGIPRRSSLSSFFAAVYLSDLDRHFEKKTGVFYLRYNDDIIILCKNKRHYLAAKRDLKRIINSLKLKLSPDKTRMGPIHDGFHFLGLVFNITGSKPISVWFDKIRNMISFPSPFWQPGLSWAYQGFKKNRSSKQSCLLARQGC